MGQHPDIASGSGRRRGSRLLSRTLALALTACTALAGMAAAAGLVPNPANQKRLLKRAIENPRYDGAEKCRSKPTDGAKALVRWLDDTVRGESWGINRCERLRGGRSFSVHSEGRAVDWRLDAGVANERRSAMRLIRTLIARDREGNVSALARRMGVQGLIFDCKAWWSGMERLDKYSYCLTPNGKLRNDLDRTQAHRDHVHIELNWPGARKRTSFWRTPGVRR